MTRIIPVFAALLLALITSAAAQPLVGGFVEGAQSWRLDENEALDGGLRFDERAYPRSEFRAQFTAEDGQGDAEFYLRVDLLSDATRSAGERVDVDLREAFIKLYLADWLDLKLGRQVATWGTGDYVFANDLFAKDWEAFFTGLDDPYLKPPQDLLRAAFYLGGVTAEIAYSPHFTPDHLPDGRRLSVFNPLAAMSREDAGPSIVTPERRLGNSELFARVFGSSGSFEWALYGYTGFWPTPQQVVMVEPLSASYLAYPALSSGGASLRGPLGRYLMSAEGAFYYSEDDGDGDDPFIANSELRGILGVERSLGNDWTASAQYYGIYMLDHESYEAGLAPGAPRYDQLRSTLTGRLTKFLLDQNLRLSFFAFYGIDDEDWHLRPAFSYRLTDSVRWTVGANLMGGDRPYTTFGQFEDNSSLYTRVRYSF